MKNIFQSDLFKDYTDKMLAHLDSEIQNDSNAAKIDLLLPGIIQHISSIKEAQTKIRRHSENYKSQERRYENATD